MNLALFKRVTLYCRWGEWLPGAAYSTLGLEDIYELQRFLMNNNIENELIGWEMLVPNDCVDQITQMKPFIAVQDYPHKPADVKDKREIGAISNMRICASDTPLFVPTDIMVGFVTKRSGIDEVDIWVITLKYATKVIA